MYINILIIRIIHFKDNAGYLPIDDSVTEKVQQVVIDLHITETFSYLFFHTSSCNLSVYFYHMQMYFLYFSAFMLFVTKATTIFITFVS